MRKLTTAEFVARSRASHQDKYTYDKSTYVDSTTPVVVTCPIHGDFQTAPSAHMAGKRGCPVCAIYLRKCALATPTEEFVSKAKQIHGHAYDYSLVQYTNARSAVDIVCPLHGTFSLTPFTHLRGTGCPTCKAIRGPNQRKPRSADETLKKAQEVHGDKYDYSQAVFGRSADKVYIICKEHGGFWQNLNSHILGCGCPVCGSVERANTKTFTHTKFVDKARAIHGNKYSYPGEYTKAQYHLTITCPVHGDFTQRAMSHLRGKGCPQCAVEVNSLKQRGTLEEFIRKAYEVHGDKYDYSKAVYTKSNAKLTIICEKHGPFQQTPNGHLSGRGCCKCKRSNLEDQIYTRLTDLGVPIIQGDRTILGRRELDIYFPDHAVAIEINGVLWHSSFAIKQKGASWVRNHQIQKHIECEQKGLRLLHYYEDECRGKLDIIIQQVQMALGLVKASIYARNTVLKVVTHREANDFLNATHLQGECKAKSYLGLYHKDTLVAVAAFSKLTSHRGMTHDDSKWELVRYSSKGRVVGGASKLLAGFLKTYPDCRTLVSYSDNRWATGNMYETLGFVKVHVTPPDYTYLDTRDNKRYHKSSFRREILAKKFPDKFDPNLSERENCHNLGFYQIFNCGLTKWELIL